MGHITLSPPRTGLDWLRVWQLYRNAFPSSERKPFSVIVRMYRKRRTDLWCILLNGTFAGFAATVNAPDTVLLDYLAICPQNRGQGIGTAALLQIRERCTGLGIFVEIESTQEGEPELELRLRRRQFYETAGFVPLGVSAMVFGVKMELLGCGCQMDYSAYKGFYRDHYSPWAAEHIHPAE